MFREYYLKINGVIFPTSAMVIPSYKVDDTPIIVKEFYDGAYNKHINRAKKKDVTISFNLRSMYSDEFAAAIAPIVEQMEIEYFDVKTNGYKTGNFTFKCNLNPQIARQYNTKVLIEELPITLIKVV